MRLRKLLIRCGFLLLLISGCRPEPVPAALFEKSDSPYLTEIATDLYLVENINNGGNVCFLVGKKGVLIVDAGYYPSGSRIVTGMIAQVTKRPVKYVVFTHCHSDHVAGVAGYPADVEIIAHENLALNLEKFVQEPFEKFRSEKEKFGEDSLRLAYGDRYDDMNETVIRIPDIEFSDTYTIDLGNYNIDLAYQGACHTDDNITVLFREQKVMHTGDLVFNGRHPYLMAAYGADPYRWRDVVKELSGLDLEAVIPGHGAAGGTEILSAQADYFDKLIEAVKSNSNSEISSMELAVKISATIFPEYQFGNYFVGAVELIAANQ